MEITFINPGVDYMIQRIKYQLAIYHHIKEIGVDAAAVFSWKVWIDGTEPFVLHHGFNNHFAQNPFK